MAMPIIKGSKKHCILRKFASPDAVEAAINGATNDAKMEIAQTAAFIARRLFRSAGVMMIAYL